MNQIHKTRGICAVCLAAGLAFSCSSGRNQREEPARTEAPKAEPAQPKLEERAKVAPPKQAPAAPVKKDAPKQVAVNRTPVVPKAPEPEEAPAASGRSLRPPRDESGRDPALPPFLTKLKDTLRRKDRDGLTALLADDIQVGPGAQGVGAFNTAWGIFQPDTSIYAVMSQTLSLPGVWKGEQFCAPYVAAMFPADLDRFKYQVALNLDVKLRAEASETSKVLATLSYSIVEILERGQWAKVRTESGVEGYVEVAYLYSPAGYRMCAAKDASGDWKVQSLVAGR